MRVCLCMRACMRAKKDLLRCVCLCIFLSDVTVKYARKSLYKICALPMFRSIKCIDIAFHDLKEDKKLIEFKFANLFQKKE